ncbi:MAG TPA: reverse transcriptase domain-containing protein [bacterium]|nr:reverse transcriptase domain-containing protein [bacterium]
MIRLTLWQACSPRQLYNGWRRVKKNQGWMTVPDDRFGISISHALESLSQEILQGTYQPAPLALVPIPHKDSEKSRILSLPPVRDRIVQSALSSQLIPLFDPYFEDCSFAYRPKRSVAMAQYRVLEYIGHGYPIVAHSDIQDCFDRIEFTLVHQLLSLFLADSRLIHLILRFISSPARYQNTLYYRSAGLPQGSPLSPLLCNVVLDVLDKFMVDRGIPYVRYADDLIVLAASYPEGQNRLREVQQLLATLGLELNPEKTYLTHWQEGFRFLGETFGGGVHEFAYASLD